MFAKSGDIRNAEVTKDTERDGGKTEPSPCPSPVRKSLMGLLRSSSTRSVAPASSNGSKAKRMLTRGQLSDLFRRLDKDGNGELDLEEFSEIINKLKINCSEDIIARIFRTVDAAKNGTLSLQEFVTAYQMIYTRPSSFVMTGVSKGPATKRHPSELICAVRYGTDLGGRTIFECMLGTVTEMSDGPLLLMHEKRHYLLDQKKGYPGVTILDAVEDMEYRVTPNWSASLHELNEHITRDALNNKTNGKKCSIHWWIDIAMKKVASFRVDKYIAGLGLPNDSKFRASFGQFGSCLPRDEKSHMYVGNGQSQMGGVSSLTMYIQSLWILGIPVVHHIPAWLDNFFEEYLSGSQKKAARDYYNTRFGFFFRSSGAATTKYTEFADAFANSQLIANRLRGEDDEEGELRNHTDDKAANPCAVMSAAMNILKVAPLSPHSESKWHSEPSWLLSSSEIKKRPAKMQFDTMSLHILDQGHGPCCLVTIREIDDEEEAYPAGLHKAEAPIQQNSKKGIIGRIVTGIRTKLLENLCEDGITAVAGDLTDSPSALAASLSALVHNFGMNTLGSVSSWMNLVANEVDDLAVSKHSAHAKEMVAMVALLRDYVEPVLTLCGTLYADAAHQRAEAARAAEELAAQHEVVVETVPHERMRSGLVSVESCGSDNSSSDDESGHDTSAVTPSPATKLAPMNYQRPRQTIGKRAGSTGQVMQLSITTLPSGCQCVPLTYDLVKGFLGADPCVTLEKLLDGDESLEIKGVRYWAEQLTVTQQSADKVKDDIRVSLEEKRNFFSFVLTVVTVFLAPLTILTGYWGMNFNNMTELDEETYKFAPGVKLLWVTAFVVYATFTVLSIHFRILYSAT